MTFHVSCTYFCMVQDQPFTAFLRAVKYAGAVQHQPSMFAFSHLYPFLIEKVFGTYLDPSDDSYCRLKSKSACAMFVELMSEYIYSASIGEVQRLLHVDCGRTARYSAH